MRSTAVLTLVGLTITAASAQAVKVPNPWAGTGVHCTSRGLTSTAYRVGVGCRHVIHQRYPRRYVVWVPRSAKRLMDRGVSVPLVVMLHGTSGDGERFLKISGWKEKATQEGFVAAFPSSLRYMVTDDGPPHRTTRWNDFNLINGIDLNVKPPGWARAATFPADDVGFLRKMIDNIKGKLTIDEDRIFLSGFSNGGQMCARVGIAMTDVVRAIGCNAGWLEEVHHPPVPNPIIPTMLTIGNRDHHALDPYQQVHPGAQEVPIDPAHLDAGLGSSFDIWLQSADLSDTPRRQIVRPHSTTLFWSTPLAGNPWRNTLTFLALDDVQHVYPAKRNAQNPHGVKMANLLWRFFLAAAS